MKSRWGAAAAAAILMVAATPLAAEAHGTLQWPPSRVWTCYTENPEHPTSDACKAAIALGGPQAAYDWAEVNLPDVAGQHRTRIPDGKLCSAGRDKYKGFDLARDDWPASSVTPGAVRFSFAASAPHKGTFQLFLTKQGYDATQPLKWSDLDDTPFLTATDPAVVGGAYVLSGTLPSRSGRQLIYVIWQRSDSPEAFYSCSDVVFGGSSPSPTTTSTTSTSPTTTSSPTVTPTVTPTTTSTTVTPTTTSTTTPSGTWAVGISYKRGDVVTYGGVKYTCLQPHRSQVDWTPAAAQALWLREGQTSPGSSW